MLFEALETEFLKLPADLRAAFPLEVLRQVLLEHPEIIEGAFQGLLPQLRTAMHEATPSVRKMLTEGLARFIGILSLTEVPTNSAMWAHYAENHKGFLLGFATCPAASWPASVVGPLCTPLELPADRVQLPVAEVGDLIAAGARRDTT